MFHEGSNDEIAGKYVTTDMKQRSNGLRRSSVVSSKDYPEFSLA
jgi:hypothetical protein